MYNRFRPTLEQLGERICPKTTSWIYSGTPTANYDIDGYWDNGIPAAGDNVVIPSNTGPITFAPSVPNLWGPLTSVNNLTICNHKTNYTCGNLSVGGYLSMYNNSTLVLKSNGSDPVMTVTGATNLGDCALTDDNGGNTPSVSFNGGGGWSGTQTFGMAGFTNTGIIILGNGSVTTYVSGDVPTVTNKGTLRVECGSSATWRLPVNNSSASSSGLIQVGDSATGSDATLTDTNWINNAYDSTLGGLGVIDVIKGSLVMDGSTNTKSTGDSNFSTCDLYNTGDIQIASGSTLQTSHGVYSYGGIINSMDNGNTTANAVLNSDVYFAVRGTTAGWIGLDQAIAGQGITGTGGARCGITMGSSYTLTTDDGFTLKFNEDWTLGTPVNQLIVNGNVTLKGTNTFTPITNNNNASKPGSGNWDVIQCYGTKTNAVGSSDFGLHSPGIPWGGAYRKHYTSYWGWGVYITHAPTGSDEDSR